MDENTDNNTMPSKTLQKKTTPPPPKPNQHNKSSASLKTDAAIDKIQIPEKKETDTSLPQNKDFEKQNKAVDEENMEVSAPKKEVDELELQSPKKTNTQPETPKTPEAEKTTAPQAPEPQNVQKQTVAQTETQSQMTNTNYQYAGVFNRFLASLLDGFIVAGINFLVGIIISLPLFIFLGNDNAMQSLVSIMLIPILSILNIGYFVYFIGKRGQTIGKKALGIKVINTETQEAPGYLHAFLRETIGKAISTMFFSLGYLWMLWDSQKQTWHDKIANTIVVKTS